MGFFNLRADRGQLSSPVTATIFEGRVARTHAPGDALVYKTGPEHRDASELTNIVKQLPNLKIYLGHPGVFPAADSGQKSVGYVEAGRVDGDTAVARMVITDSAALEAISSGTYELSLGYACGLDGERFQRNIQLDHLAIVDRARCGSVCSMKTDMEEIMSENKPEYTVKVDVSLTEAARAILDAMSMDKKKCAYDIAGCNCMGGTETETETETENTDAELNAKARNALATGEFAVPESRKLPIHDEAHVRAAMSRFGQTGFASSAEKRSAFHKIVAKAHSLGIDTAGFEAAWKGKLDSTDPACTCKNRAMSHTSGETTMPDTELQGKLDAALSEIASLKEKVTALEVEATNARKDADATKTKLDSSEAEAAKAKTDADAAVAAAKAEALQTIQNEIDARVKARVGLLVEANKFDLKDAEGNVLKLDGLSDREIKCAVIKHVDGDEVPADKPDAFVDGVYCGSLKRGSAAAASRENVRTTLNEMRKDAAVGAPARTGRAAEIAAKEAMKRASANQWLKSNG